jgi:hypothetical protein
MCQICESLFICSKKSRAKYCPSCKPYGQKLEPYYLNKKYTEKINSKKIKCKTCGKEFQREGIKVNKYCSEECHHVARKQQILKCVQKRRKYGVEKEPLGTREYISTKTTIINGQERVLSALMLEKGIKKVKDLNDIKIRGRRK